MYIFIQVGINAGVNVASLKYENDSQNLENLDENFINGLAAGLFFNLAISDNFHIQPEVLFPQKGNKNTYELSTLSQSLILV